MSLNNINTDAAEKFMEEAKSDPQVAKKTKRVEGEWVFEEGKPQFKATLAFKEGEQAVNYHYYGGEKDEKGIVHVYVLNLGTFYNNTFYRKPELLAE